MKSLLIVLLLTFNLFGVNVKTYIPKKAYKYMPLVFSESKNYIKDFNAVYYFPA